MTKPRLRSERLVPPHAPGMRIGLFGGTFDPPHEAHLAATLLALKRLNLDRVWWLVTPGNPLKDTRHLAPLTERLAAARDLTRHPRIDVSGLEAVINTRYTYDTISWLINRCPGVRFVWIMGADNLRSFHRWQNWRGIASLVPMVIVDRLGPSLYAAASPAGQALSKFRIAEAEAKSILRRRPPSWAFLHGLKSPLSSTALRAVRRGTQGRTIGKTDGKAGGKAGRKTGGRKGGNAASKATSGSKSKLTSNPRPGTKRKGGKPRAK